MRSNSNEWAKIIEAQAYTNKQVEDEEKHLKFLSKKLYRKNLDDQLHSKLSYLNKGHGDTQGETECLKVQHKMISERDALDKQQNKDIQRYLAKEYSNSKNN